MWPVSSVIINNLLRKQDFSWVPMSNNPNMSNLVLLVDMLENLPR